MNYILQEIIKKNITPFNLFELIGGYNGDLSSALIRDLNNANDLLIVDFKTTLKGYHITVKALNDKVKSTLSFISKYYNCSNMSLYKDVLNNDYFHITLG